MSHTAPAAAKPLPHPACSRPARSRSPSAPPVEQSSPQPVPSRSSLMQLRPPPHVVLAVSDVLRSVCTACQQSRLLPADSFQSGFVVREHVHPPTRRRFSHFSPTCLTEAHAHIKRQQQQQRSSHGSDDHLRAEEEERNEMQQSPAVTDADDDAMSVRARRRERRRQERATIATGQQPTVDGPSAAQSLAYEWSVLIAARAQAATNAGGWPELEGWEVRLHVPVPDESKRGAGYIDVHIQPASSPSLSPRSAPYGPPASSWTFSAIGYLSSCFKLKFATPRQGTITPSSRASLTLLPHIPPSSLLGLSAYSHCWLLFVFHHNDGAARSSVVHPPRLNGDSVGVFASRSPHRPNPIGLSLARIEAVDSATSTLSLSSIDIVHGAPILDIKPYHPADAPPVGTLSLPPYITLPHDSLTVSIRPEASAVLQTLLPRLERRWDGAEHLERLIVEMVSFDPRPLYVKGRAEGRSAVFGMRLDRLNVLYWVEERTRHAEVCGVEWVGDHSAAADAHDDDYLDERDRTKRWLATIGRTGRQRVLSGQHIDIV